MKAFIFFMSLALFGCSDLTTLVPFKIKDKVDSYHCFPHNVTTYSVDNLNIDKRFNAYPEQEFCEGSRGNLKFELIKWIKFKEYTRSYTDSMVAVLKRCDNNHDIYNAIQNGDSLYISCCYRNFKNRTGGRSRVYDKILFLNTQTKSLHIFEDIQ